MPRLSFLLGALVALGCASTQRAAPVAPLSSMSDPAMSRRAIVRDVLPHNVRLVVMDGDQPKRTASGVVVGSETSASGAMSYVLTNAHVLDVGKLQNGKLVVIADQGIEVMEYLAQPIAMGKVPEMDLALLKVHGAALPAARLAEDEEVHLGDDVVVVAAPFGRALSISGGLVSQVERDPKRRHPVMLKTDAAIGYGSSGGGVYSLSSGKLVALVEGYRTAKVGFAVEQKDFSFDVPMPGETFAAPVAKVRAFLTQNGFQRFLAQEARAQN